MLTQKRKTTLYSLGEKKNLAYEIHRKLVEQLEELTCNWPLEISPRTLLKTSEPGDLLTFQEKWSQKIHKLPFK